MKIVNIDAPRHLTAKICHLNILGFILEVMRPLEEDYYPSMDLDLFPPQRKTPPLTPIWKFAYADYYNIVVLLHTIPIYLRESRPEICEENSIVDLLGAYHSGRQGGGLRIPHKANMLRKNIFTLCLLPILRNPNLPNWISDLFSLISRTRILPLH